MPDWLSYIFNPLGALFGFAGSALTNSANARMQDAANQTNLQIARETNEANLQQVRETNASNVEQANLAYHRSLPVAQVRDMMGAGMSKTAAINKLAGGGVYSAPALQSASLQGASVQAPHYNDLPVADIFQRLADLPANQQQLELTREQIEAAKIETENKRKREQREQEIHDYEVWKRKYDKDVATILDDASSELAQMVLDSGKTPDDFKSFDSMIHAVGFARTVTYKSLPHLARVDLEQGYLTKYNNLRQERDQTNKDTAAKDAHDIAIKHKTQLQQSIDDFINSKDAREKEYAERAFKARLGAMAAEFGISEQEALESIKAYRDKDGKLHTKPEVNIPQNMSTFWDALFSIIPFESLSRILLRSLKK